MKASQRGTVLRVGSRGSKAGGRSLPACLRPNRRRGWLGLPGGIALLRITRPYSRRSQRSSQPRGAAQSLHQIPGTSEGLPAIEEAIFRGVLSM